MKSLLKILPLIIIISCNYNNSHKIVKEKLYSNLYNKIIKTDDILSFDTYMLPFSLNNEPVLDSMENSCFSFFLYGFKERRLVDEDSNSIRIVWLRSFNYPVIIRLNYCNDSTIVTIKSNIGSGDYNSFGANLIMKRYLSGSVWHGILQQLDGGFWKMTPKENFIDGNDGSKLLLEAKINGNYHIVNRWSPNYYTTSRDSVELSYYSNICKSIIRLIDLNDEGKIYGRFYNNSEW